jgi:hypothetical protein
VVYAITGPRVAGGQKGAAPEPNSAQQKRAKGGNSFSSRMEERFRRRFEE